MDYNRRIIEYLLVAVAIGLGVPVFALLGARDGERQAAIAYPRAEPSAAAAVARDYRLTVLPSADAVEQGRALFQRNCAACHGPTADGQGAAAGALKPPPRNFLDPKARWTRSRQPLNIYATVSEGNPGTAMPGFSASLSVSDRWAIVHYLGTLPGLRGQFQPLDEAAAEDWKP